MKTIVQLVVISSAIFLSGCLIPPGTGKWDLAPPKKETQTRIDEVPMYGGIDRSKFPALRESDEQFIAGVTREFGSREAAARLWVTRGFKFAVQGEYGMAIRRFNQAWLLDPTNPEVYSGLAITQHDRGRGEECEAMKLMDKTLALNPPTFQGIYTNAALITAHCSNRDKTLSPMAKAEMVARSEALYQKAQQVEPDKLYLYVAWARSYYFRGEYHDAWRMVSKARAQGRGNGAMDGQPSAAANQPDEHFLSKLRAKMPEPLVADAAQ